MSLKNQRVIVIGGTSGMGLATARLLVDAGAHVTVTSRTLQRATETARALAGRSGTHPITPAQLSMGDESSIKALADSTSSPDHIFIAAGTTKIAGVLDDEPLDGLTAALDDRIKGSLRIVRAFAPNMKAGSSFVFTGGLSTDRPIKGAWVSGLGTASAEQLARVLAVELSPIRFNAISPGWTDTPMWDAVLGDNKAAVFRDVSAKWPVARLVTPDEVASAVVFLMSNAAMNAEVLHVDGGQRLA